MNGYLPHLYFPHWSSLFDATSLFSLAGFLILVLMLVLVIQLFDHTRSVYAPSAFSGGSYQENYTMRNVTATISFKIEDEHGDEIHTTDLIYRGLDEGRILFIERHLLGAISSMNEEATDLLATQSSRGGFATAD